MRTAGKKGGLLPCEWRWHGVPDQINAAVNLMETAVPQTPIDLVTAHTGGAKLRP